MKIRCIKIFSILILLLTACRSIPFISTTPRAPEETVTPEMLQFENEMVSFSYPANMLVYDSGDPAFTTYPINDELGGQLVAGLADPKAVYPDGLLYKTVSIFRYSDLPYTTLDEIVDNVYDVIVRPYPEQDVISQVTLAGLPALQITYMVFAGEPGFKNRDIWIEKDDLVFRVSAWTMWSNPDSYSAFEMLADQIIKSLIIK